MKRDYCIPELSVLHLCLADVLRCSGQLDDYDDVIYYGDLS